MLFYVFGLFIRNQGVKIGQKQPTNPHPPYLASPAVWEKSLVSVQIILGWEDAIDPMYILCLLTCCSLPNGLSKKLFIFALT